MTQLYAQQHNIVDDHIWREFSRQQKKRNGTRNGIRDLYKRIAYDISYNLAFSKTAKLYIGTDSQSIRGKRRSYGSSIVLEGSESRKILYTKRYEKELPIKERLLDELDCSIQLRDGLLKTAVTEVLTERSIPCSIHVDINPDPNFGSNQAYANALYKGEALIMQTHEQYPDIDLNIRFKPHAVFATKIGDRICRGGL